MLNRFLKVLALGVVVVSVADFAFAEGQEVFRLAGEGAAPTDWIVRGQSCASIDGCDDVCDSCGDSLSSCRNGCTGTWLDNTEVWFGGDVYKSIGDSRFASYNPLPTASGNSFGLVTGFNSGLGLGDFPVRVQVGASYGVYDFKGRTTGGAPNDSLEQQLFATIGVYKRSNVCAGELLSWGLVYDQYVGHQWGYSADEITLGQLRGIAGLAISEANEVGVWGTIRLGDDTGTFGFPAGAFPLPVHAMNQMNAFWRHSWAFGGNSMLYAGGVDNADVASWQFGLLNTVPVNARVSLYGNFTYVAPSSATGLTGVAEEQWNAAIGLVLNFGSKSVASTVSGPTGLPLLPVANNGNFLISN